MPTVFESRRRYRVTVNTRDHPSPHVHAFGKGCEARFKLNCPDGPVEFWDYDGDCTWAHIVELGHEIAAEIAACCKVWRDIYG